MKSLILLPVLLHAIYVSAAPYIVTSYVELSVYTYPGFTRSTTTRAPSFYTYTENVTPTASSFQALSTITEEIVYLHATVVDIVLPTGVGEEITGTYDASSTYYDTTFVVPVTYTPSATCSQNWTYTTNVPVYVPDIVSLAPVTISTSASTYVYSHYAPSPTTFIIAVLNPTEVNSDDLATASSEYQPYGLSYCYTPTTYCPTTASATCFPTFMSDSSSSSYYGIDNSYYDNGQSWNRFVIIICVVVPVGWILLWLLIGTWQNWMSFKGLMLGQKRKRGLPYAWCCINFIFLCWSGPTYKQKSPEEQAELQEKWKEMKNGEKFKLWMKWGFRWKYPDVLGEEPEITKRAFRQGCL